MISDEEAAAIKKQLLEQIAKLPEEQVNGLKEKIENMSNEELEEFIKAGSREQECIFCSIAEGKTKSYNLYEDSDFIAVLEIMPASKGHVLIIPKQHINSLNELPEEKAEKMFSIALKIAKSEQELLKNKDYSIFIDPMQRVKHLALQIIPRYDKDGIVFEFRRKPVNEKELGEIQAALSEEIAKAMKNEKATAEKKKRQEEQSETESEAQKLMKHIKKRMP